MDISELKSRKKKLKLTTRDVAYLVDLPYSTVSKIFTGETKSPSYFHVEKINSVFQKLEQQQRVKAYVEELLKFFKEHPDADYDQDAFEKIYRDRHNLNNSPIPYATQKTDSPEEGNLAVKVINQLSIDEYQSLQTAQNIQLIDGKLIYAEFPSLEHQTVVENLGDVIKQFIRKNSGKCHVYSVGINLQLSENDNSVLGPDIAVCCNGGTPTEYGIIGAPDWIIEVTSPSTRKVDYSAKLGKYIQHGVKEYWIIDLQKRIVATYINDMPTITSIYQFSDEIPVHIYDGKLTIKINNVLK